jgi:hypothetical protein
MRWANGHDMAMIYRMNKKKVKRKEELLSRNKDENTVSICKSINTHDYLIAASRRLGKDSHERIHMLLVGKAVSIVLLFVYEPCVCAAVCIAAVGVLKLYRSRCMLVY